MPLAGIAGALLSIGGLVAIAGRRASLTVTMLAGLALASFAGAATALILNLAPNPYIALEVAFWLLGSLQDRSIDHLVIAAPFFVASWVMLGMNARAFRALTLGEDAAASLGVDHRPHAAALVVVGVALGVGAAVAICGLDRLRRPGRAASGAPRGRLRSGARDAAGGADRRGAAARRRHRGARCCPARSRSSSAWSPR